MQVFELIKRRRSVGKMRTELVPSRDDIEKMLEAATHAPNHHEAEPWRFFVMAGKAREELGNLLAERLAARMEDTSSEKAQAALAKERHKPLRSPILIAVASTTPNSPKVVDIENVEAVSAAIQNMLLVASELGLATIWRTGDGAYDPQVKAFFGLELEDHIVGFVYVGYPAVPVDERHPTPLAHKTRWMGWED